LEYINIRQASQKWGISERRIRILCSEGRVDGVTRSGWAWNIPATAPKPSDGRTLRHLRNFDLRIGGIDFRELEEMQSRLSTAKLDEGFRRSCWQNNLHKFLYLALADEGYGKDDIDSALSGVIPEGMGVRRFLLVINAHNILVEFLRGSRNTGGEKTFFSEERLYETYRQLFRGIDDYIEPSYRNVSIPHAGAWSGDNRSYSVSVQMKTLFIQYEREWAFLNPVVRAAFMFGELLRIQPYEAHTYLFAFLVLAGNLLDAGYPLPILAPDRIDELKADLALTLKRGNYNKVLRIFEEALVLEFSVFLQGEGENEKK
jgi:hypothetical protein